MGALRVGVIGGGQLARMMTPPAINLAIDIKALAEAEGSSAALATTMVGDYTQVEVVREFAKTVDVITFDHEHVPLAVLEALEAEGVSVQPPSKALAFAQNKLAMRKRLGALGLPMPDWAEIQDAETLDAFIEAHGGVAILKTPIGGYDGKGVRVVRSASDASDWLANLAQYGGSLLAEEKVDFVRELAQLSARRPSGQFEPWPLVQTIQENGVCSVVLAPAPAVDQATLDRTAEIAKSVSEGLGVTGVLAVEMFEARDGRILINELAMRPHNSGHFSIEGSVTSQFEQHLRAVLDLPLGSAAPRAAHAVMVNLLGVDDQNDFVQAYSSALAAHPEAKVHTYGKSARAGRKMGHVTVVADSAEHALAEAQGASAVLLRG
ncbi:5-(carboxyamino)imidazole ribonucleotide synthase [Rhodoluna limnophila]|uniref:5-(carboxyamino)imidazole ribonucleotide synthase n=1 Tax=Rhodoluna limnophila TaxID=232537 RepID=UPI001106BD03|nr:5-(carboxyamino)imidazole ribonucleotide synthase [Rhodoluna limnophila]